MQGRVHLGGALSGRDIEAVNKTVSGLTKLLFPDPEMPVPDEDLEWIIRMALESRRRVKEQQRRVFKSEFRNTHFSYILGAEGVEQFVSTPELHSDEAIESDPPPPGQVWGVSLGTTEAGPGLYRIEVTCGPGGGVKILNQPTPPAFRESVRVGEQNLYTRSKELVGDRNPREEEFSIQMRPMDADKTGAISNSAWETRDENDNRVELAEPSHGNSLWTTSRSPWRYMCSQSFIGSAASPS